MAMKFQPGRYYKYHLTDGDRHYLYRPDHAVTHWFWWEKEKWVIKPQGKLVDVSHVHGDQSAVGDH